MSHKSEWDDVLSEMAAELTKEGIPCYKNTFTKNGCGTVGHPRVAEHRKMADELTAFIKALI
jgi:hypothetical protein